MRELDTRCPLCGYMCFVYNTTDLDQVHIILNVIGSPSQEDLTSVTSEQVPSTQCPLMSLYVCLVCILV